MVGEKSKYDMDAMWGSSRISISGNLEAHGSLERLLLFDLVIRESIGQSSF